MKLNLDALFSQSHIRCRDREALEKKLAAVVEDGPRELLIISDFDQTLSRAYDEEGKPCTSSIGVFRLHGDKIQPGMAKEMQELFEKYYPTECNPHLTMEQKLPTIKEWWEKAHEVVTRVPFTAERLQQLVLESNLRLRDGAEEWLKNLEGHGIAILVFSAGIGDVIEIYLKHQLGEIPNHLHVIGNFLEYNAEGSVTTFQEPTIHVFNKNATVIKKNGPFWDAHSERKHILLMGDSLGDLHMDVGEVHSGQTIKIGFLNIYSDDMLAKFMDGFDIVVIRDQTVDVPKFITELIANRGRAME
ncbi:unnamed protein product, partial [Mesorhabditis spiculigera]